MNTTQLFNMCADVHTCACDCRSDPILQRKDTVLTADAGEMRHAVTISEPHTQPPVDNAPQYNMIETPPSDFISKQRAVDKVSGVL